MKTVAKSFEELWLVIGDMQAEEEIQKTKKIKKSDHLGLEVKKSNCNGKKTAMNFDGYIQLTDSEKKEFWKKAGLNLSPKMKMYNESLNAVKTDVKNPFTKEYFYAEADFTHTVAEFPNIPKSKFLDKDKGNSWIYGYFNINPNPHNVNELLTFVHCITNKEKSKFKKEQQLREKVQKNKSDFINMSYDERIKYLKQYGVDFSITEFTYYPVSKEIRSKIMNPFTGKTIVFHLKKDPGLGNSPCKVKGQLILKQEFDNIENIFSLKLMQKKKQVESKPTSKVIVENSWGIDESILKAIDEMQLHEKIYFDDFVALHDTSHCSSKGHKLEKINALIFILRKNGTIKHKYVPTWYCHDCKRFFMSKWQYEDLCEYGIPLCQTIKDGKEYNSDYHENYFDGLQAESILHRSGYNVSAAEDLSSVQRHNVLSLLMESGLCSQEKIKSHLTWLIESRCGQKNMVNAVHKWTEDRKFASSYKYDNARVVGVRLIRNLTK